MIHTGTSSKLFVISLDSRLKRRNYANAVQFKRPERQDREQLICRLKQIRGDALNNIEAYRDRFVLAARKNAYSSVSVIDGTSKAVEYIKRMIGSENKILAVNRSSAISELMPLLEKNKFEVVDTYFAEKRDGESAEKKLNHFWQLPDIPIETAFESFTIQEQDTAITRKDYTALLGVSAASAEDGSVFFLQHSTNIGKMLQEARRVILLVPLDKIVGAREAALFQTKCMGAFGLENVILHLKPPKQYDSAVQMINHECGSVPQEVHIIVFDNGRMNVARDARFRSILTCIGCRTCARNCSMVNHFSKDALNFPRKYLWSYLLGRNHSLEMCIGCGMCYFNCPMDINIPLMISSARGKSLSRLSNRIKSKLLYDPYPMMVLGSKFPFLVNRILVNRLVRNLMEKAVGYQKDAWIPHENAVPFDKLVRSKNHEEGQL